MPEHAVKTKSNGKYDKRRLIMMSFEILKFRVKTRAQSERSTMHQSPRPINWNPWIVFNSSANLFFRRLSKDQTRSARRANAVKVFAILVPTGPELRFHLFVIPCARSASRACEPT